MQNMLTTKFEELQTPYKLGKPVLAGSGVAGAFDSAAVDCPFIFYHSDMFHMMYVGFDGTGYQTALATSTDLIHWKHKGTILERTASDRWDNVGCAGTWIIKDTDNLFDVPVLKKIDNRYWMIYHSYPDTGYEAGPAEIGFAWTEDETLLKWNRLDKPVFTWRDGAEWERGGLYKSCIVEHDNRFHMFYNAKNCEEAWTEQIGVATSRDLVHWERLDSNPVVRISENGWDSRFNSDPCVLRYKDKWLMFYFGYDCQHSQEGLAVSDDLIHWEKAESPIIPNGGPGDLDEIHAHKPAVVYHNGILYHFYTAVGNYREGVGTEKVINDFRCITVATSKRIQP